MEAGSGMTPRIDQLIDLFNHRRDDLPDGLFDRRTQFVLNGRPFEETLGRSPSDPLVLMLARGPAGYRFSAKALLHAVPDARIARGEVSQLSRDGVVTVKWQCWLSGHLRGTHEAAETVFDAEFALTEAGVVARASVVVPEAQLERIREARLRP